MPDLIAHDLKHCETTEWLVGVDEAGRGALAGPVVAGAVILNRVFLEYVRSETQWARVNDSKQLPARVREGFAAMIDEACEAGWIHAATGSGSVEEIERGNILGATRLAMQRALESACPDNIRLPAPSSMSPQRDLFASVSDNRAPNVRILVDGRPLRPFPYGHMALVKGDASSFVIALASILAKVKRDQLMSDLDAQWEGYGFSVHKGYGTVSHREALQQRGACPQHRRLFLRKLKLPTVREVC